MRPLSAGALPWALVVAAIACNAMAQVLLKRAAPASALPLQQWIDPRLGASVVLYGCSFVFTALVYARLPLSLVSPLMAGAVFVVVALAAVQLFGEALGPARIAGMALVLAGIALLARSG
ncbi:MAG TPA: SMR family transporter [Zeimonas sp.]